MKQTLRRINTSLSSARMSWSARRGMPVRFTHRGKRYWLNADNSAVYHVLNSTEKIANMTDLIPHGAKTILDIGGNCGLFSAFSEISSPTASIHCFEPSRDLLPIIQRNVSKDRVHVHDIAVGDSDEDVELFVNPGSQQTNSLNKSAVELFADNDVIETRTVKCTTLDRFARENLIEKVDVLKVDVQGYEGAVFRGAKRLLPTVDWLFVESTWMDIDSILELIPFALAYGFTDASVLNSVHLGADVLLSRQEVRSPSVKTAFRLSDDLLTRRWT